MNISEINFNINTSDVRAFFGDYELEIIKIIEKSIILKQKLNDENKPDLPVGYN